VQLSYRVVCFLLDRWFLPLVCAARVIVAHPLYPFRLHVTAPGTATLYALDRLFDGTLLNYYLRNRTTYNGKSPHFATRTPALALDLAPAVASFALLMPRSAGRCSSSAGEHAACPLVLSL
jgi:hypothetical protein